MFLGTLATADPSAEIAKSVGVVFWLIISIVGLIKCFSISRRETTSTLCVHGLTFGLIAYALSQMMFLFKHITDSSMLKAVVTVAGAVVISVMGIVGIVLAIIGLATYNSSYSADGVRREYVQGKRQAGWGIALNVIYITLFLGGLFIGFIQREMATSGGHLARGGHGESEFVFDDENFRVSMPDSSWVKMDAATVNPEACIMLVKGRPPVYFGVIAEKSGVDLELTLDQVLEFVQSNLKVNLKDAEITEGVDEEHNGLSGRRFQVNARLGTINISYEFWCVVTNGYCYQVMLWADSEQKEQLSRTADEVYASFHQIDPLHRCYSGGTEPFNALKSEVFGYELDLKNTDWLSWDEIRESDALADCGGLHPSGPRFSVVPMIMPKNASLQILQKSFLDHYGYSNVIPTNRVHEIQVQGLDGLEYTYENEESRVCERLIASENCIWLISFWDDAVDELDRALVDQFFSSFKFSPEAVLPEHIKNLSDERRVAQSELRNRVGLGYYNETRFDEAISWFKSGYAIDQTNVVYYGNILAGYSESGAYEEGLKFIDDAADTFLANDDVKQWRAELLGGAGKIEASNSLYEELFSSGFQGEEDLREWTQMLADNGLWENMDQIFADYSGDNPSEDLTLHQLELYYAKGDYKKVVDLARSFMDEKFSTDYLYWIMDAYQEMGLYSESLDACNELLEKGYRTVEALQEKAYCEYQLNWYKKAKSSLEEALKLNPKNETTIEWLELVSAALGEGDNSCLKESIEPVPFSSSFTNELVVAVPAEFGADFGAYYELHQVLWNFQKEKELKRTDVRRVRILDETGVSTFSSFEFTFNPVSEQIFVNKLQIRNAEGKVVAEGAVKDYFVLDDDSDSMVDEDQKLVIPVPGLRPGYSIDLVVTRLYGSSPAAFYFKQHYLASGSPVLSGSVFLSGDVDKVKQSVLNGAVEVRKEDGVLWKTSGPYTYQWEPMQVPFERFIPGVILGTGDESWEKSGTSHYEEIQERLVADEKVKKQAKELVAGLESQCEKYEAIVNWVRSSFTYKSLEFGRSGTIPDYPGDTFSYHYGDCKDLSVLLKVMLNEVGVKCELVLVHTEDDLVLEIPTVDQFNHMITYLPEIDGGLFVDPTDQEAAAFLKVPQQLSKRKVLILGQEAGRIMVIPEYPARSSTCEVSRTIHVGKDGVVSLSDQIELNGFYAAWMRSLLKDQKKADRVHWYQKSVADYYQGLEVLSVDAEHVRDNDKPLKVQISYQLNHAMHENGDDGLRISVPSIWGAYYFSFQNVQDRKNPFKINYPLDFKLDSTIKTGEGYSVVPNEVSALSEESSYFDWTLNDTGHFSCQLKTGIFEADQYREFIETVNKGLKAARKEVKLRKAKVVAASENDKESAF